MNKAGPDIPYQDPQFPQTNLAGGLEPPIKLIGRPRPDYILERFTQTRVYIS